MRVIAEGVETELVAAICQRLGCDWAGASCSAVRPDA